MADEDADCVDAPSIELGLNITEANRGKPLYSSQTKEMITLKRDANACWCTDGLNDDCS